MKVKFWSYTQNGGDGSAYPLFFATEKDAEKYAEKHGGDERYCDDINCHSLEFDENGKLLNPYKGYHNV